MELFDTKPTVVEKPGALLSVKVHGTSPSTELSSGYRRTESLNGVSLRSRKAQPSPLRFPSAAAKRRFMNLILRFLDPEQGDEFLLEGKDIFNKP